MVMLFSLKLPFYVFFLIFFIYAKHLNHTATVTLREAVFAQIDRVKPFDPHHGGHSCVANGDKKHFFVILYSF